MQRRELLKYQRAASDFLNWSVIRIQLTATPALSFLSSLSPDWPTRNAWPTQQDRGHGFGPRRLKCRQGGSEAIMLGFELADHRPQFVCLFEQKRGDRYIETIAQAADLAS